MGINISGLVSIGNSALRSVPNFENEAYRVHQERGNNMSSKLKFTICTVFAILTMYLGNVIPVYGVEAIPNYQLKYLGIGSPSAINNNGVVVGVKLNGINYEPLVSSNGSTWLPLPIPVGATSVFPTDVNDSGVIVGVSYANWVPSAVRWTPTVSGYVVETLPRLAGDTASYATGINNLGQIVGARSALGYVPTGQGWLYSDTLGLVALSTQYGLWTVPSGINDLGQIISGVERLDLNTGVITDIGSGPSNYNPVTSVAINNNGMIVGSATLRSSSLNIVSVFRYEGAAGWRFIEGSSRYTTASSINNRGDIGYGELGAGLYLDGQGTFALGSLLDPALVSAGWAITSSAPLINDQRIVAATARNSITGETGGVLLTPNGTLQPPTAPVNLQGVAHIATRMEPYNAINLTWENTSSLTRSYELERRQVGATTWTLLSLTPPGTATNHTDTTVGVGIAYEYRVRAVGIAGTSLSSNIATVTSPVTPLDTTPPVVTISSPLGGASVTGTVNVSAQATDNVAVEYLEISYWNQYLGQQVIIGSVSNSGTLSVNWNTNGLTPAAYALKAYAYDTLGNWTQTEITINVGTTVKSMKVTTITLSGTVSGNKANITGYVSVKDGTNVLVSGANVTIRWKLPNGSTKTMSALTSSSGQSKFTVSSTRGTYTLTVSNVTKAGSVFDALGSILSKSITK